MKKQSIWVFEWRKSVHYWWIYILFSPECKELNSMLDPLLYRWGVPPVVIRCVHWTMQMWVLQTWIKALGLAIVMCTGVFFFSLSNTSTFLPICSKIHRVLTWPHLFPPYVLRRKSYEEKYTLNSLDTHGRHSKIIPDSKAHGANMGPRPGFCRTQMCPMLAPWALLSGIP